MSTSRKFALIVGTSDYDDPTLAKLKTPDADVRALAEILRDPAIGGFDSVTTLVNQLESDVSRSIESFFAQKKPDDLLLLYFSGHGVLDDRGRLYLAVKDTKRELLKSTAIAAAFVTGEMDSCRSKRQVLILDCCHSGAFERGAKGDMQAVNEATFEGNGYGRIVLTASDSTQYALEGDQVIAQAELSLFTHFLIQGLQTGEADTDGDGRITLDELYEYVHTQVLNQTRKQTPQKWGYKLQGELLIAMNPHPQKVKVGELPVDLRQAIESPFAGIRAGVVDELRRLLSGSDEAIALAAREALLRLQADDSRKVSE
ncbi:MAG: caspase family protein, partial [candidate division KSB1 bacterium]|nr:caspase family protein [candidate division KSB1 bacterium]